MASDVAPSLERLIDQLLPVEVDKIESAFDEIWRESSPGTDASSVRLRISNVVVWGEGESVGARFEHLMETLAQRHPCRGILVALSPTAHDLTSAISAHCWRTAAGGRHICSEEIVLEGPGGARRQVASALLALLVSELPVHLWLTGDPEQLATFPAEVIDAADRVYVDSALGGANVLRALIQNRQRVDSGVIDLAWLRGEPWRELCAQLFDGPGTILIDQLVTIEVEGGSGAVSSSALLLGGWLVSALGLTMSTANTLAQRISATFYDGTRGVSLVLAPGQVGCEIQRVSFRTADVTMNVELRPETGLLHVESNWRQNPISRTVAHETEDDAMLVLRAIEDQGDPGPYERSLGAAVELGR